MLVLVHVPPLVPDTVNCVCWPTHTTPGPTIVPVAHAFVVSSDNKTRIVTIILLFIVVDFWLFAMLFSKNDRWLKLEGRNAPEQVRDNGMVLWPVNANSVVAQVFQPHEMVVLIIQ